METLPNRASDAGPESKDPGYSWRDFGDFACEEISRACRSEQSDGKAPDVRNIKRLMHIDAAIRELERAKELLCR
jgi:hypothetical protein